MAHDDQLCVGTELLDEIEKAMQVYVVQRRLDLVHDIEGGRPATEHGEEKRQGNERSFAARQQREAPHVAPGGPGFDLDPRREQVLGIDEAQTSVPPGNSIVKRLSKWAATSANA